MCEARALFGRSRPPCGAKIFRRRAALVRNGARSSPERIGPGERAGAAATGRHRGAGAGGQAELGFGRRLSGEQGRRVAAALRAAGEEQGGARAAGGRGGRQGPDRHSPVVRGHFGRAEGHGRAEVQGRQDPGGGAAGEAEGRPGPAGHAGRHAGRPARGAGGGRSGRGQGGDQAQDLLRPPGQGRQHGGRHRGEHDPDQLPRPGAQGVQQPAAAGRPRQGSVRLQERRARRGSCGFLPCPALPASLRRPKRWKRDTAQLTLVSALHRLCRNSILTGCSWTP
eukprot:scaffold228_cov312-Pinguiococcus_pyrenoidosus.AAC.27